VILYNQTIRVQRMTITNKVRMTTFGVQAQ
jgi:hypothetical protein